MTNIDIYTQTITFTTMRVQIGNLNRYYVDNLEDHINRLHTTIHALNMCDISKDSMNFYINGYLKSIKTFNIFDNHSFRLVAFIKAGDRNLTCSYDPLKYTEIMYDQGFKLQISQMAINSNSQAIAYKTNNYLDNKLQLSQLNNGINEALRFNEHGYLCEGCYTNVFIIDHKNCIKTPSLDNGLLSGIMRKKVMDFCKEMSYDIQESYITMDDIRQAESIFITNSLMGVMWVNEIQDVKNSYTKSSIIDELIANFKPQLHE